MKKNILFMALLILMSFTVFGDHTLTIPNYFDVNISERILINNGDLISEQNAFLFLENSTTQFNKINNNETFELFILNNIEEDLPYLISITNSTTTILEINSSDGIRDTFDTITDTKLYGFRYIATFNLTAGYVCEREICPFIYKLNGNPIIKSFFAMNESGTLVYQYSSTHQVTHAGYQYICLNVPFLHGVNKTGNFTEYLGFQCTNCDSSNSIRLGVDNNPLSNSSSFTQINFSSPFVNESSTHHDMFKVFRFDQPSIEEYRGIFKFRIPFYYSFHLFNQFNDTFSTKFDYIYLKENIATTDINLAQTGIDMSESLSVFSNLLNTNIDTDEVFWGEVNINTAVIKLYESGNYSINLLTVKSFIEDGWDYEFIKPQYTNSKIETLLVKNIDITLEQNSTVNIALSEYESNKKGFWLNFIKWGFLIMILFIGLTISFMSEAPFKVAGAVLFIWTILVKLIGGIDI